MIEYKDKLLDIMDNTIKHLEPNLYNSILDYFIENKVKNTKVEITKAIRKHIGIDKLKNGTSYTSTQYWIVRGWIDNPMNKVREFGTNRSYNNSPYRKEYWMSLGYSESDAINRVRIRRSTNKEYWISLGYSESDAIQKVFDLQTQRNVKSNLKHYKGRSPVDKEYWINKGYSLHDALEMQYKRQNTFSDEKQIELYGYPDALFKKYPIECVSDKLYSKNIKIHKIINISKSYEEYKLNYEEYKLSLRGHASNESLVYILPLYEMLNEKYTLFFGSKGFKEKYFKYDKAKFYRFDFLIEELKIIYEYGGEYHFNNIYNNSVNIKKLEIERDEYVKSKGYKVYHLTTKNKFEENVKIIYNSFIENNVKYNYKEVKCNKFYKTFYDMEKIKNEN